MADPNSVETAVTDLEIGMYVSELDRPWMETPFLVQGFYVNSQEDIDEIEKHCKYVYVDVYRSRLTGGRRNSRLMGQAAQKKAQEPHRSSLAVADAGRFQPRSGSVVAELFGHLKLKNYSDTAGFEQELGPARAAYTELAGAVSDMMERFRSGGTLDLSGVRAAIPALVESVVRNPDACVWLAGIKNEDTYVYRHAVSSAVWALALGRKLGFPNVVLQRVATGALLFDVGKLKIPRELLEKRERLSQGEFELLKSHVDFGMEMLKDSGVLNRTVADMIESHHERHGGHGYPHGLKGDAIPVFGRIAAIVDCYDAITSRRAYSPAMSPSHAVKKMYAWRDIDFQGELVEEFIQALGPYPAGTLVELSSGEVGVVLSGYRSHGRRPQLLMVLDSEKQRLRELRPLDLAAVKQDRSGAALDIATSLEPGAFGINPDELSF